MSEAPALEVAQWFNTPQALALSDLRGKVVVLHAFQMLCPGCVQHGIPQAQRIHAQFDRDDVEVIGLHTVFEHHDVMGPAALKVFIHENRLAFPIGVDQPDGDGGVPRTMSKYGMRGTPTLLLIDRQGALRFQQIGQVDDLAVGALVGQLLAEAPR